MRFVESEFFYALLFCKKLLKKFEKSRKKFEKPVDLWKNM